MLAMFALLLACAIPSEPASTCHTWAEVVELSVDGDDSVCPDAADVAVDQAARYQGCDGEEVVEVLERVSEAPMACGGWRACSWACTYRATVRSCATEPPTGCWIS